MNLQEWWFGFAQFVQLIVILPIVVLVAGAILFSLVWPIGYIAVPCVICAIFYGLWLFWKINSP